ncbi:ATP-dependent helicase [Desulfolucanica intricata]|uniref:ATP-dependent helicase n=1 Tax=Desulfolucanica intricata TaxID=1285191 RepID=UPI000831218E|nr:UvrD-helicase domain-containing protein [Desulfolucanica intricata]
MDLRNLNPAQKEAVLHIDGPCCTIAGAGSGKTRVLTNRIAYLIENGMAARNILAVTFTRKAANEMQERLEPLVGPALEDLHVGTFHSICYKILREEWQAQGVTCPDIAGDWWQKRVLRDLLAPPTKQNPDGMNWELDVSQALSFISWQKNNLRVPNDKLDNIPSELTMQYRTLYQRYEAKKEREGKLDFDDMLLWCWQLLQNNPAVRAKYANLFRYILIDEYQDTCFAQNEILKLLAAPLNNVFVVGDARQSIYGWRAARVEFILQFEKMWTGAKIVILETNYRSTSNIVELSNHLIELAGIKYPGKCAANRGAKLNPVYIKNDDEEHEALQIVEEIKDLTADGEYRYRDCAILYRVNAQSRALEDALIAAQVPYVIIGSAGFYQRKEVKDILAYLRILEDPNDTAAIRRVINTPTRYLGKVFLQRAEEYARQQEIPLLEAIGACPAAGQYRYRGAKDFLQSIRKLKRLVKTKSPAEMVMEIRRVTGYDHWLVEEEGSDEGADNTRIENLNALAGAAERFNTLREFLFYAEQAGSQPANQDTGQDRVQLMTLHRSKGLEFPVVFLTGMVQGLLPHRKSCVYINGELVPESVEEERRLCYVGMTRARERLYLSAVETYQGKPAEQSSFLAEIWSDLEHDDNKAENRGNVA